MNGQPARVVILVRGPVSLEAAAIALKRGHTVTTLERTEPGAWG